jgi:hypothetical protein
MRLKIKHIGTPPDLAIVADHIGRVDNSLIGRRVRDDVLLLLSTVDRDANAEVYMIDSTVRDGVGCSE